MEGTVHWLDPFSLQSTETKFPADKKVPVVNNTEHLVAAAEGHIAQHFHFNLMHSLAMSANKIRFEKVSEHFQ